MRCASRDCQPLGLAQTARSCAKGGDLGCPRSILYVDNLAASQRYYRDKLGFKIDWTDGDPPDFGVWISARDFARRP